MLLFSHRKFTSTSFHEYFQIVLFLLNKKDEHILILKQSFLPFQLPVLKVIVNINPPVI